MGQEHEDAISRGRAQGWPDGLVERAMAVKTPSAQLNQWLAMPTNEVHLFEVQRTIEVFERLATGPYRAREMSFRDQEAFQELWANGSEKIGDWLITVERSPDSLAQFRLQANASISVIEEDGQLVACTVWSPVNCLIGGAPVSIHYAMGLRVHASRRREGLGDLVRRFPSRALQNPTVGQVLFLRLGNVHMESFLEAVKFPVGGGRPPKMAAVAHLTAKASAGSEDGVRPVEPGDLAQCAEIINRTHAGLDLFAPYGPESLRHMLDGGVWGDRPPWQPPPVYGWADFKVVEEAGRIVACGGLWDRGRDMREVWRSTAGEEDRRVEVAAALDLGCEEGREDALARLLQSFASQAAGLGRQSVIADLGHINAVTEHLGDLEVRWESRIIEWTPYLTRGLPRELGDCAIDLRYW